MKARGSPPGFFFGKNLEEVTAIAASCVVKIVGCFSLTQSVAEAYNALKSVRLY
jgi:hypothetical protein